MEIVAKSGPDVVLIQDGDQGIVADMSQGLRWPPRPFQSILARGYWEEWPEDPHTDPSKLIELMAYHEVTQAKAKNVEP